MKLALGVYACIGMMTLGVSSALLYDRDFYEDLFFDHIETHGLKIKTGDFSNRLNIFANNVDNIYKHNHDATKTYEMGVNKFTHLTFDEFVDVVGLPGIHLNMALAATGAGATTVANDTIIVSDLPSEVDWVSDGGVTPVKNQGQCGSCWSFSATGALEGAYFVKWGQLVSFSEQELVSCDTGDSQCNGGLMDNAFAWVKSNGGLATESDYPYVSGDGTTVPTCAQAGVYQNPKVAPTGWVDVKARSMSGLMAAVAQQPVSIAIQANQPAFQSYSGGVLTGRCGTRLDHGVLLVGYGTSKDGIDYWKIKNSWGSDWGMDGYILIERSNADLCGVMDSASYPTL
jgi:hypothetical protein